MSVNWNVYKIMKKYKRQQLKVRYELNAARTASAFEKENNEIKIRGIKNFIEKWLRKEWKADLAAEKRRKMSRMARKKAASRLSNQNGRTLITPILLEPIISVDWDQYVGKVIQTQVRSAIKSAIIKQESESDVDDESMYNPSGGSNSDSSIASRFNIILRDKKLKKKRDVNPEIIDVLSSDEEFEELERKYGIKKCSVKINKL